MPRRWILIKNKRTELSKKVAHARRVIFFASSERNRRELSAVSAFSFPLFDASWSNIRSTDVSRWRKPPFETAFPRKWNAGLFVAGNQLSSCTHFPVNAAALFFPSFALFSHFESSNSSGQEFVRSNRLDSTIQLMVLSSSNARHRSPLLLAFVSR